MVLFYFHIVYDFNANKKKKNKNKIRDFVQRCSELAVQSVSCISSALQY